MDTKQQKVEAATETVRALMEGRTQDALGHVIAGIRAGVSENLAGLGQLVDALAGAMRRMPGKFLGMSDQLAVVTYNQLASMRAADLAMVVLDVAANRAREINDQEDKAQARKVSTGRPIRDNPQA